MSNDFSVFSSKIRLYNLVFGFSIALMHVNEIWKNYYGENNIDVKWIPNYAAMPFFFFMSSFWFFYDYQKGDSFKKLKKRIFTLLIPYFFWGVVKLGLVQAQGLLLEGHFKYGLRESLLSLGFARLPGLSLDPLNGPLWYMMRLMTYFIFAPVLYILLKEKFKGFVSCIVILVLTIECEYYTWGGWIFTMSLGAYIALNYKEELYKWSNKIKVPNNSWLNNKVVLTIANIVFLLVVSYIFVRLQILAESSVKQVFPFLFIMILLAVPTIKISGKIVQGYSFVLYCSHVIWATAVNKFVPKLGLAPTPEIGVFVSFIIVCILSLITYIIVDKISILRKLGMGGR